jgi:hypothetical protein
LGHGHAPGLSHGAAGSGHSLQVSGKVAKLPAKGGQGGQSSSPFSMVLSTLSPVNIFSLALGYGATGILLTPFVAYPGSVLCAIAGGVVFNYAMVQPLMRYLAGFATKPSEGIEGSVFQEAEAITGFDKDGRGIVRLTMDGQHVQLLATLDLLEVEKGIHVKKGEKVLITEVDSVRNSCRVTRELAE